MDPDSRFDCGPWESTVVIRKVAANAGIMNMQIFPSLYRDALNFMGRISEAMRPNGHVRYHIREDVTRK